MAKKSVIAGEYIIEIADDGHVDVLRIFSNSMSIMTDIAKSKNFPVDPKWNTQDLGRHLVKEFGDGKSANIDGITIKRQPNNSIEVSQEIKTGKTRDCLRKISEKEGFAYDEGWNTQTLGAKLTQYLIEHKEEADKILKTPNARKENRENEKIEEDSSIVRYVSLIEITGKATLYAGYDDDVDNSLLDSLKKMSEDDRYDVDYDWAEEITDGNIDCYSQDSFDGWSFDNTDLSIRVVYEDGEEESFNVGQLNEKEGETNDPETRLLRRSYSKYVVSQYNLEDELLEIKGNFDVKKLSFVVNKYTVNEDEFSTYCQLDYDGTLISFYDAPEGCDEKWAEFSIMCEDEVVTF